LLAGPAFIARVGEGCQPTELRLAFFLSALVLDVPVSLPVALA